MHLLAVMSEAWQPALLNKRSDLIIIIIIRLFHAVVGSPQLRNKLPRTIVQIQSNTKNQF